MFKVASSHLQNTVITGLTFKSWAIMFEIHFWRTVFVCVWACMWTAVCVRGLFWQSRFLSRSLSFSVSLMITLLALQVPSLCVCVCERERERERKGIYWCFWLCVCLWIGVHALLTWQYFRWLGCYIRVHTESSHTFCLCEKWGL